MRILVVGSGGREHALAWKLAQSPKVGQLFVAPGNGGTAQIAQNVPISADDNDSLLRFVQENDIDLTVVGPEAPLVAGLVDAFTAAGLRAFGPTAAAAQLEGSKAFAKHFMIQEGIPTAVGAVFRHHQAALAYLDAQPMPIVIKASGLAAGKGVFVCATKQEAQAALHEIMVDRAFGPSGDEVLIEECLKGEEASLLAFSDGKTVVPMLPARDYKRIGDGDEGPNTGGMGCYAPSSYLSPELISSVVARVLQPTVDGMRQRGIPYVGVLYAGIMLTANGPRVLEFNCRFGDPETQVLLPLLDTDLVDIFLACIEGRLQQVDVHWKPDHAVAVVMASGGYPGRYEKDKPIHINLAGLVFHAGTRLDGEQLLTSGGRVLAVTCTAPTLEDARTRAYQGIEQIHFENVQYRTDIASLAPSTRPPPLRERPRGGSAYAAAGVDIEAKSDAFRRMRAAVENTYTPAVLAGIGSFGGLFALDELLQRARDPVLVSSTDGVGTKTMIAVAMGRYDSIGYDIVNHCINDTLVQGARPLFFLDYIASSKLDPDIIVQLVSSCAAACKASNCVLIGGETAEMPGVYHPGSFDLVGTMVGWVDRNAIVDGNTVQPGDVCLGLSSSGLHTNGYSLARRVFANVGWETVLSELGRTIGEVLLEPHRSYLPEFEALSEAGVTIKAMAHITGGGFPDNLPRVIPGTMGARLDRSAWPVPSIFQLIQQRGQVNDEEMVRVFNMGIGMILIVAPDEVDRALAALSGSTGVASAPYLIGETMAWDGSGSQVQLV
ncbi:MAG: phosphoribosylamine--glycine ligase [Anaerolineae bacterium]|nr:phosphoribosylamine--glycine ligase [Anaerolineae bacterium]